MNPKSRFLVIEDDADGEFLIQRALIREFPGALVKVFGDAEEAVAAGRSSQWTGFIVHRALDMEGIQAVRRLRAVGGEIPIVMMSGRDQSVAAKAAGATHFVSYTDWQRLAACFAQLEGAK